MLTNIELAIVCLDVELAIGMEVNVDIGVLCIVGNTEDTFKGDDTLSDWMMVPDVFV